MNAAEKKRRSLFKPQLEVLDKACVSCPFKGREGDFAFADVLNKLRVAKGLPPLKGWDKLAMAVGAKENIAAETLVRGDFACHHSVYDSTGDALVKKDVKHHRQCPGALANYRGEKQS